jgi:hypothetical protein
MLKIITQIGLVAFIAVALLVAGTEIAAAKIEGDTIILGGPCR